MKKQKIFLTLDFLTLISCTAALLSVVLQSLVQVPFIAIAVVLIQAMVSIPTSYLSVKALQSKRKATKGWAYELQMYGSYFCSSFLFSVVLVLSLISMPMQLFPLTFSGLLFNMGRASSLLFVFSGLLDIALSYGCGRDNDFLSCDAKPSRYLFKAGNNRSTNIDHLRAFSGPGYKLGEGPQNT